MINKMILHLWIKSKIETLEFRLNTGYFYKKVEDVYRAEGELRILKELYEDFDFASIKKEDIEYHNKI